jgi:ketosteroid isomerase-like protein
MSNFTTVEKFLDSYVDELNKGNIDFLLKLYEVDACFVSQGGQLVKGQENIRQSLQSFID